MPTVSTRNPAWMIEAIGFCRAAFRITDVRSSEQIKLVAQFAAKHRLEVKADQERGAFILAPLD